MNTATTAKSGVRRVAIRQYASIAGKKALRAAIVGFVLSRALVAHCAAEESNNIEERIAKNFLEELLAEGGIKKTGEGLGFAGSQHLGLDEKTAQTYARFAAKLTENHPFRLILADRIAANGVYKDLLQKHGNQMEPLIRALARDILEYRPPRAAAGGAIDAMRTSAIAIVTFASFNGARGLAFANPDVKLIGLGTEEAASLAKSLGADYLISVKLAPYILNYDPMGAQPGTVRLWYHARVYDDLGQVIFDEKIPGDESVITESIRFVGYQLPFLTLLKMSLTKVFFLFPTDAQSEQLSNIESRLLLEILLETHEKLAERMIKH
jgi:hypothetical protein